MAGTTNRPGREQPASGRSARRRLRGSDPDRVSVILFSLAAVLVVLAVLAGQLSPGSSTASPDRQIVIRKIYRTTVVESGTGAGRGTSMSQSVSSSGSGPSPAAAPATRSSH